MKKKIILSAGGFDPTAGAGLLCDSYLFSKFNVDSKFVITCIVVQSPFEVKRYIEVKDSVIKDQVRIIKPYYDVGLINMGLIKPHLIDFFKSQFNRARILLDPIMTAGSGKFNFLSDDEIVKILTSVRGVYLITPNVLEAEKICNKNISNLDDMKECARILRKELGVLNVLISGGHLRGKNFDLLLDERGQFFKFKSQKEDFRIHGTGSFYNSGISIGLAKGMELSDSIEFAKEHLNKAAAKATPDNPILRI